MNGGENNEEFIRYKNNTLEKLSKIFNAYTSKILSFKVENKDIIYDNLFKKEIFVEQKNNEIIKKIEFVNGLISLFNFSDYDEVIKREDYNLLMKKRKLNIDNKIKIINNRSNSHSKNNIEQTMNNEKSVNSSNKTMEEQENIELKGIEIKTDFTPILQKIRDFTKTRLPVIYSNSTVKMEKYFHIKSYLDKFPNYDYSLGCSDLDDRPIEPSMLSPPSEIQLFTQEIIRELKYNYPKMDSYLNSKNSSETIKTKTLLYSIIDYQTKKPQYYYYYLSKNKELHNSVDYKFIKLAIVRKVGGKIQNILKSTEKKFKSSIIRKDNQGNTMIKGELSINYEALINYFLSGGKSMGEISYIQFEVFLFKSDLFKDIQNSSDTIYISDTERNELNEFQKKLEALRSNL